MGVWDTFKRALGLERDPVVRPPEPPALTPGAERRLSTLPAGHGLILSLAPTEAGWLVQSSEGSIAASCPGFEGAPVACDDLTFDRLRGLQLDHDGAGWRVSAEVTVRARETPNPDSRLYLTDRRVADGRVYVSRRTLAPPWLATRLFAHPGVQAVLLREGTLTVDRTPGAPWDAIDRVVGVALREHALALGPPAVPREDLGHDALLAEVRAVLEHRVLPAIHADGGHLELLAVDEGIARVRMVGACRSCPASVLTLKGGVERVLREAFPNDIERVEAILDDEG